MAFSGTMKLLIILQLLDIVEGKERFSSRHENQVIML